MATSASLGCRDAAGLIARRTRREMHRIDAPSLPSEGYTNLPYRRPRPAAVFRTLCVPHALPEAYSPDHRLAAPSVAGVSWLVRRKRRPLSADAGHAKKQGLLFRLDSFQAMLLHLLIKRGTADAEFLGRMLLVPAGDPKRMKNDLPLRLPHGVLKRLQARARPLELTRRAVSRNVLG